MVKDKSNMNSVSSQTHHFDLNTGSRNILQPSSALFFYSDIHSRHISHLCFVPVLLLKQPLSVLLLRQSSVIFSVTPSIFQPFQTNNGYNFLFLSKWVGSALLLLPWLLSRPSVLPSLHFVMSTCMSLCLPLIFLLSCLVRHFSLLPSLLCHHPLLMMSYLWPLSLLASTQFDNVFLLSLLIKKLQQLHLVFLHNASSHFLVTRREQTNCYTNSMEQVDNDYNVSANVTWMTGPLQFLQFQNFSSLAATSPPSSAAS